MAEKHIRLKSVYKRDMRDQRRGMVKAKLLEIQFLYSKCGDVRRLIAHMDNFYQ